MKNINEGLGVITGIAIAVLVVVVLVIGGITVKVVDSIQGASHGHTI